MAAAFRSLKENLTLNATVAAAPEGSSSLKALFVASACCWDSCSPPPQGASSCPWMVVSAVPVVGHTGKTGEARAFGLRSACASARLFRPCFAAEAPTW